MLQKDKQMKEIKAQYLKIVLYLLNTKCTSERSITEIDNAKDIDIVIPIYNLIEYSNNLKEHLKVYVNITKMSQLIT